MYENIIINCNYDKGVTIVAVRNVLGYTACFAGSNGEMR